MQSEEDFTPGTPWKPFHTMTFLDYEFTIRGNDIEFDDRVMPQQLDVKNGDKFTVKIDALGKISLIKDR